MRHRVAVIGSSETARALALLLVARDDCLLVLTGEDGGALQAAATALGVEPRVQGPVPPSELTAAVIAVVCDAAQVPVHDLRDRAPAALLVVATEDPARDAGTLQTSLRWPRQRVLGVDADAAAGGPVRRAAAAARLVDHVLADRRRSVPATVQTTAEGGEGGWASVPVTVGAQGALAIDA